MSDEKKYNAEEAARAILGRIHNQLKKHENILSKSKNSTHEIDLGDEPNDDNAECPESLGGSGSSEGSSEESGEYEQAEYSEDSGKEDEVLSDYDNDDEDEDKKKKKKDGEEDSEEDSEEPNEDDYDFKKSESGMFEIEYQRIAKAGPLFSGSGAQKAKGFGSILGTPPPPPPPAPVAKEEDNADFHHSDEGGIAKPMSDAQNASFGSSVKGKKGSKKGHKDDSSPGQNKGKQEARARKNKSRAATAAGKPDELGLSDRREKKGSSADREKGSEHRAADPQGKEGVDTRKDAQKWKKKDRQRVRESDVKKSDNAVKETAGIDFDEENTSDKGKEEKKGIKRPLEKCGDMVANKKSEKLFNFLKKKEVKLNKAGYTPGALSSAATKQNQANFNQSSADRQSANRNSSSMQSRLTGKQQPAQNMSTAQPAQNLTAPKSSNTQGPRRLSSEGIKQANAGFDQASKDRQSANRSNYVMQNRLTGKKQTAPSANKQQSGGQSKMRSEDRMSVGKPASFNTENKQSVAPTKQKPIGSAKGEQKPTADIGADNVAKPSFKEAFAQAREDRIAGKGKDVFEFGGKKFHSFSKDDFNKVLGNKYNRNAKVRDNSGPLKPGVVESGKTSIRDFNVARKQPSHQQRVNRDTGSGDTGRFIGKSEKSSSEKLSKFLKKPQN